MQYLRRSGSSFQLVLWTTADSYDKVTEYLQTTPGGYIHQAGWGKHLSGCDLLVNRVKISYNTFFIGSIEQLLARFPSSLHAMFNLLKRGKRYTSVSNIGRLLAVNEYGGIYTDIDYLMPREGAAFPGI